VVNVSGSQWDVPSSASPRFFLFDEPLSNLDAKLRVQMRAEISKLHSRLEATMIYVTHDQVEAMTMGNRIVVMKDGLVQQIDTPLRLYDNPINQFVAGFIGSPSMNFISGQLLSDGNGTLAFDEGNIQIQLPQFYKEPLRDHIGKTITFGIRPEDIHDPETVGRSSVEIAEIVAKVEVVEPMGSEVFLYLTTGKSSFVARVDPLHMPVVGQEVKLAVEVEKAHFFVEDTLESLIKR